MLREVPATFKLLLQRIVLEEQHDAAGLAG
jgi:hypothetical protein